MQQHQKMNPGLGRLFLVHSDEFLQCALHLKRCPIHCAIVREQIFTLFGQARND